MVRLGRCAGVVLQDGRVGVVSMSMVPNFNGEEKPGRGGELKELEEQESSDSERLRLRSMAVGRHFESGAMCGR
jgi:hypothetical protein